MSLVVVALSGVGAPQIRLSFGLSGLRVGNATFGGANALVFSAGPGNYGNGVLGILTPAG